MMISMPSRMIAMNDKQRRFVDEYLIDQNATRAAIAAGYSPKTARAQGCRLLTNADIATEIRVSQGKLSRELNITARDKRAKLWEIARFCGEVIETPEGDLRMRNPRAATAAIAELNKMDGDYQQKAQEESRINFIQIFDSEDRPEGHVEQVQDSNWLNSEY
ncbi:terminase small subunit [Endozoicomonas acroporae]|uniref:terminase small subunit n=1 Tax=Endozoicomonas acroporae TaxID=1701104 RepID=UPI001C60B7E0|nr:terminase small subunit [Endozoicomonas acroporae]